jgi:hypothetical protein
LCLDIVLQQHQVLYPKNQDKPKDNVLEVLEFAFQCQVKHLEHHPSNLGLLPYEKSIQ